jgi:high-affinity Fe2+/Pb2+ permease
MAFMLSIAIFVHILVLDFSRVIMLSNCTLVIVMALLAMPVIVSNSKMMKQSVDANEC